MKRLMLWFGDVSRPLLVRVLTSRAHRLMSAGLMVIRYHGRRSGRTISLVTGYHDFDGTVIVTTSIAPRRTWWRNFTEPHPAELCVKGEWRRVEGVVLDPGGDDYREWVQKAFSRGKVVAKAMGVDFDPAVGLTDEAVATLAATSCVTRFAAPVTS